VFAEESFAQLSFVAPPSSSSLLATAAIAILWHRKFDNFASVRIEKGTQFYFTIIDFQ
jgi:hypothetical protein